MKYFEDDSHTIPDYIKNMPREELKKRIAEYDAKMLKARKLKQKTKPVNA